MLWTAEGNKENRRRQILEPKITRLGIDREREEEDNTRLNSWSPSQKRMRTKSQRVGSEARPVVGKSAMEWSRSKFLGGRATDMIMQVYHIPSREIQKGILSRTQKPSANYKTNLQIFRIRYITATVGRSLIDRARSLKESAP